MRFLCFASVILLVSCSTARRQQPAAAKGQTYATLPDNRQTQPLLRDDVFALDSISTDKSYGYTQTNPVMVGGMQEQQGVLNQRRYLNALLGPSNQRISYIRTNSCCGFATNHGISGTGFLDVYKLWWEDAGPQDTLRLYLNFYDAGPLKAPAGLRFRKQEQR